MQIVELVLKTPVGGEIGRYEVKADDGQIDLPALCNRDLDLRMAFSTLTVGDTITVEERWSEEI